MSPVYTPVTLTEEEADTIANPSTYGWADRTVQGLAKRIRAQRAEEAARTIQRADPHYPASVMVWADGNYFDAVVIHREWAAYQRAAIRAEEARPIQPGDRVRLLGDGPNWRPGKVLAVESSRCWVRWDGYPIPNTHSACGLVRVPVGGDNL